MRNLHDVDVNLLLPTLPGDRDELAEGEIYLDSTTCDDDHWAHCVKWARDHPHSRVKAANELLEAERPRPCPKITQTAWDQFSTMIHSKCHYVSSKTVEHLVRIFGGADETQCTWNASTRSLRLAESLLTPGA